MWFSSLRNVIAVSLLAVVGAFAQAPANQARVIGVVTEKQGSGAKVRNDAGEVFSVVFAPDTKFQRIAPGQTSLKDAATITMGDINDGDRVLARGTATDAKTIVALSVVLMSKTDLAEKQQKERQDWQKRGIAGTVTAVDQGKKQITIRLPQLAAAEQLVVLTLKDDAPMRRYAADSVKFADAKPSTLAEVKPGDQLRARGDKSEDGTKFTAEEIVTGSFQTIAATVVAIRPEANEVDVKNLDTNKNVTVKLTADSTLKRMASFGGGAGGPGGGAPRAGMPDGGGPGGGAPRAGGPGGGGFPGGGPGGGPGGPGGPGGFGGGRMPDLSQMLERMPATTLAEVKPGETILVAGTRSANADRVTAITMLAGAERFVEMRRAMMARAESSGRQQGPGGNWNLDGMSMIPMQ